METNFVLEAANIRFARLGGPEGCGFDLEVLHLAVHAGETVAVCGPSGSGKSSLLSIMAGLMKPASGVVWHASEEGKIDPYAISRVAWRRHRRHIGFVDQDPRESLNDRRTVAEIVADPLHIHALLPRRERREKAIATLQMVGITPEQAERQPDTLSGGQRQRVALARAIVTQPSLIFLDEPTSALDPSVQAAFVELLRQFRTRDQTAAYILVTHDLALARQLADRIFVLDRGRVVDSGPINVVFSSPTSSVTKVLLDSL